MCQAPPAPPDRPRGLAGARAVSPDVSGTRFQHPRIIPGPVGLGGGLVAAPPAVLAAMIRAHQPPAINAGSRFGGAPASAGCLAVRGVDRSLVTHMAHRSAILTYACRPVASTRR